MSKKKRNRNKLNQNNSTPLNVNENIAIKHKIPEMEMEISKLEHEISSLQNKIAMLKIEKNNFNKKKQDAENKQKKLLKDKNQQQQHIDSLNKKAAEIREAIRKIDELKLATHTENSNSELLTILQQSNTMKTPNGENDDKTLAVAVRYKLNDLIFYTNDKNLKNKATSVGVKTS
ncbi:PIN domain-containing protein [Neisseria zalophi]|uniref:PIN domain-containing protein n=1 Tax=Neisseria zalophi TaxID=640030 RepID=A0A5J6PYX9_9NEIS|nr:hypothetical protein [Neisseria zalophi]QEY26363.1 hypothetical protein D0T92_07375 [Neisseria zalophi]